MLPQTWQESSRSVVHRGDRPLNDPKDECDPPESVQVGTPEAKRKRATQSPQEGGHRPGRCNPRIVQGFGGPSMEADSSPPDPPCGLDVDLHVQSAQPEANEPGMSTYQHVHRAGGESHRCRTMRQLVHEQAQRRDQAKQCVLHTKLNRPGVGAP
jgi:hypothetical protein